jgi:PRTRC genetic system protein A
MKNLFSDLVQHHIYQGGELPPLTARAYDYILAGNGLFKRAESQHIKALIPVALTRVAGLPDLEQVLQVSVHPGRIPERLLHVILDDARRRARIGQEQMYLLQMDGARVRIVRPAQRASGVSISYQAGEHNSVVCDLHSHHNMSAFFSGTDDCDEKGFRFYAVIGKVLTRPEIKLRLGVYGDFIYLPVEALFTGPGPFVDCYREALNAARS